MKYNYLTGMLGYLSDTGGEKFNAAQIAEEEKRLREGIGTGVINRHTDA